MKNLILVKLGGSVITDKSTPYKFRKDTMISLAKQLKSSKANLLLGHGAGSFGHTSATKYGGMKGYKSKIGIAKVCKDAIEINNLVIKALVDEGVAAVSFSPMSMITTNSGKTQEIFFDPLERALNQGLIPVVYGDVILDKKWKTTIYSGEKILNQIAIYFKNRGLLIDKIIQVGITDGLYDKNKNTIPEVTKKSWPILKKFIFKTRSNDVTGGMFSKIENALFIASHGIKTVLINGNRKNELRKALLGKKINGTIIKH